MQLESPSALLQLLLQLPLLQGNQHWPGSHHSNRKRAGCFALRGFSLPTGKGAIKKREEGGREKTKRAQSCLTARDRAAAPPPHIPLPGKRRAPAHPWAPGRTTTGQKALSQMQRAKGKAPPDRYRDPQSCSCVRRGLCYSAQHREDPEDRELASYKDLRAEAQASYRGAAEADAEGRGWGWGLRGTSK